MTDDKILSIKEMPLFNYENPIQKIIEGKITKLCRRHHFENGIYRLRKQINDKNGKLLNEHIEIVSSEKVLYVQISNQLAKEILGATGKPLYGTYTTDLYKLLAKTDLAYVKTPYVYVHEFEYVKKPVQMTLDTVINETSSLRQ